MLLLTGCYLNESETDDSTDDDRRGVHYIDDSHDEADIRDHCPRKPKEHDDIEASDSDVEHISGDRRGTVVADVGTLSPDHHGTIEHQRVVQTYDINMTNCSVLHDTNAGVHCRDDDRAKKHRFRGHIRISEGINDKAIMGDGNRSCDTIDTRYNDHRRTKKRRCHDDVEASDDNIQPAIDGSGVSTNGSDCYRDHQGSKKRRDHGHVETSGVDEIEPVRIGDLGTRHRRRTKIRAVENETLTSDSETCEDDEPPAQAHSKRNRGGVRVKWSDAELKALLISFRNNASLRKPPNAADINSAIQRFPCLKKRSLAQIKSRAWHLIKTGR
jgi:hypothetical protein